MCLKNRVSVPIALKIATCVEGLRIVSSKASGSWETTKSKSIQNLLAGSGNLFGRLF